MCRNHLSSSRGGLGLERLKKELAKTLLDQEKRSVSMYVPDGYAFNPGDVVTFDSGNGGEQYVVEEVSHTHDERAMKLRPLTMRDEAKNVAFTDPSLGVPFPKTPIMTRTPSRDWNW